MEFQTCTLANGIKIIHAQVSAPVAHCGFLIHTGSRDESDAEIGMAHFAEHIFFKNTHKRNTYQILSRLEDVGGDMNAYTTKEETCLQASFIVEHYERALELMSDLVFNRCFQDKDVEKEKEVVIDEINSYRDTPSENIFDDFDALMFGSHPFGHPILGRAVHVRKFTADRIEQFVATHYYTDRMVIASAGAVPFARLVKWCEKYFGLIPARLCDTVRVKPETHAALFQETKKHIHQGHCCLGAFGYSFYHPRRICLSLLCNLLGGPGMNTRLNMALREHKGLSYSAEASYTPFTDTGIASVYFSADKENTDLCLDIVHKELQKLRTTRLGTMQLHRAQRQMLGQIAISCDSNENLMLSIGKSFLVFDKVDTLAETALRINRITAEDLMETANEIWTPDRITTLIYR